MRLSIVSTLYNSQSFIPELFARLVDVVGRLGIQKEQFEIILVDDGSPDDSLRIALQERKKYPDYNIRIIELSRNFGHHNAILAGLAHTQGEYVFLIDSDMEVSPEVLITFYNEMISNPEIDVVFGYLPKRSIRALPSILFWKLFRSIGGSRAPLNITTERLMARRYVDALLSLGDFSVFLGGMLDWVGFNQKPVPVQRICRREKSNYTLSKKINLFLNWLVSFTAHPIYLSFRVSILIIIVSFIYVTYFLVIKILYPEAVISGFTSIIFSIYFMGGIILFFVSMIGLYIGKIFDQVKNRPRYIIRRKYD